MAGLPIGGIVFDLDGTLVDSGLDFDQIRQEMDIEPGRPVLESLASLPEPRASRCREILARHEWAGAQRARLMPGVADFLTALSARKIRQAVLTRNGRQITLATLARLGLEFDLVMAREDAPAKPDPAAIWKICEVWGMQRPQVAIIGDFRFDIEAGRRAGVRTVMYTKGRDPGQVPGAELADFCLRCFSEADALLAWLGEPT